LEEFVPFILIFVTSFGNPQGPLEIERAELVYPTLESCEKDGREMAARRELYVDERGKVKVSFQCVRAASEYETDLAWQEWRRMKDTTQPAQEESNQK
jgi:hypothetical protein